VKAGWKTNSLEDCLERFRVPAKIQRKQFREAGTFPIISQEADFVNGYWDNSEDVCVLDRPVVIFGDHTQVLKYVDFDFVVGADGVKVLAPKAFMDAKYLYYFVMANRAPSLGYARHYRHVKELAVSYPEPEEQQRIVAVLDEAFEGLARARAHAEANLQNARELFESYLSEVFQVLSETYSGCSKLHELSDSYHQGLNTAGQKVQFVEEGYPIIQTRNITDGVIDVENKIKFMSGTDWERYREKFKPNKGDIFFTNIGTIGKTAVLDEDAEYLIHWNIFKISPRIDAVNSYFLKYRLDDLTNSGFFKKLQKGGTVDFVTKKMLSNVTVPTVPLGEQGRVVLAVQDTKIALNEVVIAYQQKLQDLDDLRQSLLQKAFAGELTRCNE
jgi:type I restriction enzyme, S subunit